MEIILRPNGDRPSHVDLDLKALDQLAEHGAKVDHPKLKPARKTVARLEQVRAETGELRRADYDALIRDAAARYLEGDLPPSQIPAAALEIEIAAQKGTGSTLARLLDEAVRQLNNQAARECAALGDVWITEILRPAVDRALAGLSDDVIAAAVEGVHMPTHELKHARVNRAAIEQVEDTIAHLDDLANRAIKWRNYGWTTTLDRRTGWQAEDFRWLHHDKLPGRMSNYTTFWLRATQAGAEPGIYTAAEIMTANPSLSSEVREPAAAGAA